MRTHTLSARILSVALCFGILLSGPVMAGSKGIIKDIELSKSGTLYGQVYTPDGTTVPNAVVQLRYQGKTVAAARSNTKGEFAIGSVRSGAHEVVVGTVSSPVRLWSQGAAPAKAQRGLVVRADQTIIRGQDEFVTTSGFGLLDVITLTTMGSAVGALVYGIHNDQHLDDIEDRLDAIASP